MVKKLTLLFLLLLIISLVPRIWDLDKVQPHLSNDEISIAYDAYSMLRTGKDEHGITLPISFLSLGFYKAPVYTYLLTPFIFLNGNNNISARLPSAIAGIITVIGIGFLTFELTRNKTLGYLSSLVLAYSPWHIFTSRMVLESNIALMFLVYGILFFLKFESHMKNISNFGFSILFLVLSIYAYHTEWVLVPFLSLVMFKYLFKDSRRFAFGFILGLAILLIPLSWDYLKHLGTGSRANTEVIWKDPMIEAEISAGRNILSKTCILTGSVVNNFFQYTNPGRLYFYGLALFKDPFPYQQGLFLATMCFPFVLGVIDLKRYILSKYLGLFIFWLFISPAVSALTTRGNLIRDLVSILPYSIILAIGIKKITEKSKTTFFVWLGGSILLFIFFFWLYIYHYPVETAGGYEGYKPIADYLASDSENNSQYIIDDRYGEFNQYVGVPRLYMAYYNSLDPKLLQYKIEENNSVIFGKYRTTNINWGKQILQFKSLYIVGVGNTPPDNLKPKLKLLKSFSDAAGKPAFEIWQLP